MSDPTSKTTKEAWETCPMLVCDRLTRCEYTPCISLESAAKTLDAWAVVDRFGRFTLSCLYPSQEEANEDRKYWIKECGWRVVPMKVEQR